MGIGRVIILPLDVLKINQQINPDVFRGCGVVKIFIEEGTTLYRGPARAGVRWTVARNAPGSFAVGLFPTPATLPGLLFSDIPSRSVPVRLRGVIVSLTGDYRGRHPVFSYARIADM